MVIETLLTAYLKRKYSKLLRFSTLGNIQVPRARPGKDYLVYVHIPFCEKLCPYCSFNRFLLDKPLAREYLTALEIELRMYADLGFNFTSVYVGGGTPTVLPQEMARLLDHVRSMFPVREVSLETNPNHLTDSIVPVLKDAGVNRLSVGVQSFDDSLLQQMERYHKYGSGAEIRDTLTKYTGLFDTLNVDMIFNFPTQTSAMLTRDIEIIRQIKPDQVTFYPLMVSDSTRRELAEKFGPISYSQEKTFYEQILEKLHEDYTCGTAWCFSRRESMIDEYIVDYDEYVGVGSGSFGYVNGTCFANTFSIQDYLKSLTSGKLPLLAKKDFSMKEQIHYGFMMKLFGRSLDLAEAERNFGGHFASTLRKETALFRALGALKRDNGVLKLTRYGLYLWVIMMREFFTGVNNFRENCRAQIKATGHCVL